MKRMIALISAILLFYLCGCSTTESQSPASSRNVYFSETHDLDFEDILLQVKVDRVLDETYYLQHDDDPFIPVHATVEEIFYAGKTNSSWPDEGDPVVLWINTYDLRPFTTMTQEELDTAYSALRQILKDAEHLIVYGSNGSENLLLYDYDPAHDSWLREHPNQTPKYQIDGDHRLTGLPAAVKVNNLVGWTLMPFPGGNLDAEAMTALFRSVGSAVAFDLSQELPQGDQYFKTGDSLSDVAEAMRKYVKKCS